MSSIMASWIGMQQCIHACLCELLPGYQLGGIWWGTTKACMASRKGYMCPSSSPFHDQTKVYYHKYCGKLNNETHVWMMQSQSNMRVFHQVCNAASASQDNSLYNQEDKFFRNALGSQWDGVSISFHSHFWCWHDHFSNQWGVNFIIFLESLTMSEVARRTTRLINGTMSSLDGAGHCKFSGR